MPATRPKRQTTAVGLLTAVAGTALFIWLVLRVGPREIGTGFQKIGWGLAWIFLLGGLRFAARAAAWTRCVEPPHRLPFTTAFGAIVCGDALGNVTPFGPLVSEPTKIAYVRGQLDTAAAVVPVVGDAELGSAIEEPIRRAEAAWPRLPPGRRYLSNLP